MMKKLPRIAGAVASFALAQAIHAANVSWNGGGATDDWNDTANWGGGNPGALSGDQAVFSGAGDSNTPTINFAFANPNDLTTRNSALITIQTGVSISGFGAWRFGANGGNDGGALTMTGGALSGTNFQVATSPAATSRSSLTVSGGSLTTTAGFSIGTLGDFTLSNNTATFSVGSFSVEGGTGSGGSFYNGSIFNAIFNSSGISTVAASGAFTIGNSAALLNIDLSAFSGTGTFDLVTYGSRSGAYNSGSITGLGSLSGGRTATLGYDADSMYVSIVPEPSSIVLFGFGTAGLIFRRRRG